MEGFYPQLAFRFTRDALESEKQRTLAMIKPDGYQKMGQILSKIQHETGCDSAFEWTIAMFSAFSLPILS